MWGSAAMLRANEACRPCTEMSHVVEPSWGPFAKGTRLGFPLRLPVVSSTTHQGAIPASRRASGLNTRQNAIEARRFARCRDVIAQTDARTLTLSGAWAGARGAQVARKRVVDDAVRDA